MQQALTKSELEQLAKSALLWPDPISDYLLSLPAPNGEDERREALLVSFEEDREKLTGRYFPDGKLHNPDKLLNYAYQAEAAERKLQGGALYGFGLFGLRLTDALTAAAWGSSVLSTPKGAMEHAIKRLENIHLAASAQTPNGLTYAQLREFSFTQSFLDTYNNQPLEWRAALAYGRPTKRNELTDSVAELHRYALLSEQDKTGKALAARLADEICDEPTVPGRRGRAGKTADRQLPVLVGKALGARAAQGIYVERYMLLH